MRTLCIFLCLAACGGIDATSVSTQPETATGLVNGGFEDGLNGWSSYQWSGLVQLSNDGHSGRSSLQLGTPDKQSGYSEAQQSFTVPKGHPKLTFWYRGHCQYQPSTGGLSLIGPYGVSYGLMTLAYGYSTCHADSGWTQVTWDLTPAAGKEVTLMMTNHDYGTSGVVAGGSWFEVDDFQLTSGAPAPTVVNGGFEDGLQGWSSNGDVSVVSGGHSGSFALEVGSADPTDESEATQTFTIPAAAKTLSFWVQVHCPDQVRYDWTDVMITDLDRGVTAMAMGLTCTDGGGWQQVTWSLAGLAGHRATLSLHVHDDGWFGDGTYALFDDVVVQ